MQLIYLVLTGCCLAAALQDVDVDKEWLQFKQTFNKSYSHKLYETKSYLKFKKNFLIMLEHNGRYDKGEVTYKMGINEFSDKDITDMRSTFMGLRISSSDAKKFHNVTEFMPSLKDIPDSVDWRTVGAVTPVKSQGQCGSCSAFAAIGALESANFLKNKKLIELSEQNLIDCAELNKGCNGGWDFVSYDYIIGNGGIDTESSYPYKGIQGKCNFKKENVGAICNGYTTIVDGNENYLKAGVATLGPFSLTITVTDNFHRYKSGVFSDETCSFPATHAVVVVGYGTENDVDYWLVKNSWGAKWGEEGYIKMARNKNSQCLFVVGAIVPNVLQN